MHVVVDMTVLSDWKRRVYGRLGLQKLDFDYILISIRQVRGDTLTLHLYDVRVSHVFTSLSLSLSVCSLLSAHVCFKSVVVSPLSLKHRYSVSVVHSRITDSIRPDARPCRRPRSGSWACIA